MYGRISPTRISFFQNDQFLTKQSLDMMVSGVTKISLFEEFVPAKRELIHNGYDRKKLDFDIRFERRYDSLLICDWQNNRK